MSAGGLLAARILDLARSSLTPRNRHTSSNGSSLWTPSKTHLQAIAAEYRRRCRVSLYAPARLAGAAWQR
jgi:hypothetical protein